MKNLFIRLLDIKLSFEKKWISLIYRIKQTITFFSKKEYLFFLVFVFILFISTIGILQNINKSFMIKIPHEGGSITEGIIGSPRFINPLLATSEADKDLTALIYSGLMRKDIDGSLIFDLAEKYEISKDKLIYTFTLKDEVYFHDGKPITIEDIMFTINKTKDEILKSPQKINWEGITLSKIDDKTISFSLKQPYSAFLENTTLGIMPSYIWEKSPIELNNANINPIGSGPYKIDKIDKKSSGIINYYDLKRFKKFILGKPYIKKIKLKFYLNENDLVNGLLNKEIDQANSINPSSALLLKEKGYKIESIILPRIFGLFFNQNQNNLFTNKNIITAIDLAINKEKIIEEVLLGYGETIDSPIPSNMISYQNKEENTDILYLERLKKAEEILSKDGWKKNSEGFLEKSTTNKKTTNKKGVFKENSSLLQFSISTGNAKDLKDSAELIKNDLEKIGIKVEIKTFEIGNLNQSVIRPRKYDALLFGQIINNESDLFAFWHSSQRKDPGINIAIYTNAKVDKILEDAFITIDEKDRIKKYIEFENEIKKDKPAIFLYSPNFIYIMSKKLKNPISNHILIPSDRFLNSYLWYTETDNIWKAFSKK